MSSFFHHEILEFINGQLWNAFQTIPSIMNVTLVPYGNANETYRNETGMYQWACQHRVNECWGNLFETCLIHYYPDFADHFPVVHCMELNTTDIHAIASSCSASFNVTGDVVSKCMMTKMGNQLQHQMAVQTRSLNPPHTYVPWVTVNGVHTEDIQQAAQDDLVALICKTYQVIIVQAYVCVGIHKYTYEHVLHLSKLRDRANLTLAIRKTISYLHNEKLNENAKKTSYNL